MKILLITLLSVILITSIAFSQDSLKIASDDWNHIRTTALELDSSLTDCEELNNLYENRMTEFQMQLRSLDLANQAADTIIVKKDMQLEKRKEQVAILNAELNKKRLEIWMYRGGGIILIVAGLLLLN